MLEIKELTKQYGAFTVLDGLTVSFDKGVYGLYRIWSMRTIIDKDWMNM